MGETEQKAEQPIKELLPDEADLLSLDKAREKLI